MSNKATDRAANKTESSRESKKATKQSYSKLHSTKSKQRTDLATLSLSRKRRATPTSQNNQQSRRQSNFQRGFFQCNQPTVSGDRQSDYCLSLKATSQLTEQTTKRLLSLERRRQSSRDHTVTNQQSRHNRECQCCLHVSPPAKVTSSRPTEPTESGFFLSMKRQSNEHDTTS
jgi:hypothetical protein